MAARTGLVGLGHVNLDAVAGQRRGERAPARRRDAAASARSRPLTGIHFDRFIGRNGRFVAELGKRQPQLVGADPFRFLTEEPLTEEIELMAERRVLALDPRELVLQRRDERPGGPQIIDASCGATGNIGNKVNRPPASG